MSDIELEITKIHVIILYALKDCLPEFHHFVPNSFLHCLLDPKDPIAIERLNLMNMAKLSIKGLIESALNLGRTLDSDYAPLQQFFVVMEHCLKHGLKSMCISSSTCKQIANSHMYSRV